VGNVYFHCFACRLLRIPHFDFVKSSEHPTSCSPKDDSISNGVYYGRIKATGKLIRKAVVWFSKREILRLSKNHF